MYASIKLSPSAGVFALLLSDFSLTDLVILYHNIFPYITCSQISTLALECIIPQQEVFQMLYVYDSNRKTAMIRYSDILCIKRVNRRLCYLTDAGLFYGPITMEEFAELHVSLGFRMVDKQGVINMEQVDHIIKGSAYIRGVEYPISRRKRKSVTKYLDDFGT